MIEILINNLPASSRAVKEGDMAPGSKYGPYEHEYCILIVVLHFKDVGGIHDVPAYL